jgi:RNA polymerase sigma factor for flagellar operon FliA
LAVGLVAAAGDLATAADPGEDPEQICARVTAARELRAAVQALPERQRMLVERHYFAEQRFDHIAAELGISKSRASRLHGEAIRTLAEWLGPEREAEE